MNNNSMEWKYVDNEGNMVTFVIEGSDENTWITLMDHFQRFLAASGYIFGEEFSIGAACEDAHALYLDEKCPPHNTVPNED